MSQNNSLQDVVNDKVFKILVLQLSSYIIVDLLSWSEHFSFDLRLYLIMIENRQDNLSNRSFKSQSAYNQLRQCRIQLNSMRKKYNSVSAENLQLHDRLSTLQNQFKYLQQRESSGKDQQIEYLRQQNTRIRMILLQLQKQKESYMDLIDIKQRAKQEFQDQLEKIKLLNSHNQQLKTKLQSELADLKLQLSQISGERDRSKENCRQTQEYSESLQRSLRQLKQRIREIDQECTSKIQSHQNQRQSLLQNNDKLTIQNTQLLKQLDRESNNLQQAYLKIQSLEKELQGMVVNHSNQMDQLLRCQQSLKDLEDKIKGLEYSKAIDRQQRNGLSARLNLYERLLKDRESQICQLKAIANDNQIHLETKLRLAQQKLFRVQQALVLKENSLDKEKQLVSLLQADKESLQLKNSQMARQNIRLGQQLKVQSEGNSMRQALQEALLKKQSLYSSLLQEKLHVQMKQREQSNILFQKDEQIENLKTRKASLEKQVQSLELTLIKVEEELHYQKQLTIQTANQLETRLFDYSIQITRSNKYQEQLQHVQTRLQGLQQDKAGLCEQNSLLRGQLTTLMHLKNDQIEKLKEMKQRLQRQHESISSMHKRTHFDFIKQQKDRQRSQTALRLSEEFLCQLRQQKSAVDLLNLQLNSQMRILKQHNSKLQSSQNKAEQLTLRLSAVQKELAEKQSNCQDLIQNNSKLTRNCQKTTHQTQEQLRLLQTERDGLKDQMLKSAEKTDQLQHQNQQLQQQLTELRRNLRISEKDKDKLKRLQQMVVTLNKELTCSQQSSRQFAQDRSQLHSELKALKQELLQLNKQLQYQRKRNLHLQQLYSKYRALKSVFVQGYDSRSTNEETQSRRI